MNRNKPAFGPTAQFWLFLALIILLGVCLRSLWIDWQPIWWDEGYSIYFATESIPQMLALTARDIHPPLYYALLHAWSTLTDSTDPATLRTLSILIGALALPIFAWLTHILFRSSARTLIATLLLAVSPIHLFYSQELRMYGLALLLGLVTTIYLWNLFTAPSPRAVLGYALAISLALYTIYYSALLILAHAIWLLWQFRTDLKKCKPFIISALIAALLYLPWLIYTATNLIRYVGEKIGFDDDTPLTPAMYLWRHLTAFTSGHLPNDNRVLFFLSLLGAVSLILLIGRVILHRVGPMLSSAASGESERSTRIVNLAARPAIWCWFAIPAVIGFLLNLRLPFFPDGGERLLLFVLPHFLLLVADGIVCCFESGSGSGWGRNIVHSRMNAFSRFDRATGMIALLGLLVSAGVGVYNFYTIERYADRNYRPIVKQIVQQGGDEDILLAIFPWQVGYWRAYTPAELRHQELLLLGQNSLEWNDEIRTQIDDALLHGGTLWFPAPLSLGSDLPSEIEAYLASTIGLWSSSAIGDSTDSPDESSITEEANKNNQVLINVETRWVNETTRLSAWRLVPPLELSTPLSADEPLADFGEIQLLSTAYDPTEVASANSVVHIAMEWSSVASIIGLRPSSATDDIPISPNESSTEWQFSLRLLDGSGRSRVNRSFRSMTAERWRSDVGFVVPAGLPPGPYELAIGVDRINTKADREKVTTLRSQSNDALQESTEFVRLGNLVIIPPVESMAPYRLPMDRAAVPLITDGGLTLLGLSGMDPEKSALAGTRIGLDIFLQNQSATPSLRTLYVSLLNKDGAGVAGGEGWPLPDYPTDGLAVGALVQVPFEVELPATLASGMYRLIAGFVDAATDAKSPAAQLGTVRVMQRTASFNGPTMRNPLPVPARFGSHIDLLGYDMIIDEQIRLTLYWRAEQALLPQHNIFVHWVAHDGGDPLAQWDGIPQSIGPEGELVLAPSGSWQAGEFLATQHLLPLVDDYDVTLHVGLYLPASGARLPVSIDGAVVGDFVRIEYP